MNKIRLDKLLLSLKHTDSREKAKRLIEEGKIKVDGIIINKCSREVCENAKIEIERQGKEYVGRGAFKLLKAFDTWELTAKDKDCADFGASTGGFTEVLLEKGAKKIYAIDVGHGQLAEKLKNNEKVINIERINLKNENIGLIDGPLDLIVCDLSFISILKVLKTMKGFLKENGEIIILIKPQFELSKKDLNKKGVVKDLEKIKEVLTKIKEEFLKQGFQELEIIDSPILGGEGNKEFLMKGRLKKNLTEKKPHKKA